MVGQSKLYRKTLSRKTERKEREGGKILNIPLALCLDSAAAVLRQGLTIVLAVLELTHETRLTSAFPPLPGIQGHSPAQPKR